MTKVHWIIFRSLVQKIEHGTKGVLAVTLYLLQTVDGVVVPASRPNLYPQNLPPCIDSIKSAPVVMAACVFVVPNGI